MNNYNIYRKNDSLNLGMANIEMKALSMNTDMAYQHTRILKKYQELGIYKLDRMS